MEETVLLLNMTLLLLVGAVSSIIFKKLKMPAIIGYLVTGIILANYWMGMSADTVIIVTLLANMGLVLLMFCIGLELNIKKLRRTGMFAMMVVMIQIPLMLLGGYVFGSMMGWTSLQCIVFGGIISGSSTAVVTAVLADQHILTKEEAQTVILVTVIEDVAQVLILSMLTPMFTGGTMSMEGIVWMLTVIILFMVAAMVFGLLIIPKLIDMMGDRMPGEVLLVFSLGLCFAMSLLSVYIGMSMAIGAFLMGVIVSQSRHCKQIETDVTPIKNIFMVMFFISIGLEITPSELLDNIGTVLMFFSVFVLLKISTVFLAYFVGDKPMRISFASAVSLAAMGEFAFIIGKTALDANVISTGFYTSVIGAALLSMIVLPLISRYTEGISDKVHEYAPAFLYNSFLKAEKVRDGYYQKMALSSKATAAKFRQKLTMTYVEIIILVFTVAALALTAPMLSDFVYTNVGPLDQNASNIIILFIDFLILMIPLYPLARNMKFLEKFMLDVERRAEEMGHGNLRSRWARIHKEALRVNIWMIVFFLDFVILMIIPNNVRFMDHLLVTASGIIMIAVLYFLRYWNKS